jgi:Putative Ig domain
MAVWATNAWATGAWATGAWADGPSGAVAPTITTTALDSLRVGIAFSQQLYATGDEPITWSGSVPAGLTLSNAGLLSGTPEAAGAYSFTLTATNATGNDTQAYAGSIELPGVGGVISIDRRRGRR